MATTLCHDIARTNHDAVERFIERLAAFSLDNWLSVAAACERSSSQPEFSLHALIAHHRLGMDAWRVADDIETAAYCSLGSRGFAPSREGAALRLARGAATTAAIALLVRSLLSAEEFDSLYRPFVSLVPVAPKGGRQPAIVPRRAADRPRPLALVSSPVE
jgi:hypothetical protein